MIQVRLNRECNLGNRGDVLYVTRNVAFGLVDRGDAVIYKPAEPGVYKDRMMNAQPRNKRFYHRKVIK